MDEGRKMTSLPLFHLLQKSYIQQRFSIPFPFLKNNSFFTLNLILYKIFIIKSFKTFMSELLRLYKLFNIFDKLIDIMMKTVCIGWQNLTLYRFSIFNNKSVVILNEINGLAEFGTLTAVMGPSGSGLTSLLQCLNGLNHINDCYLSEDSKIYSNKDVKIRFNFYREQRKGLSFYGFECNTESVVRLET